jgi:hypothetical protein
MRFLNFYTFFKSKFRLLMGRVHKFFSSLRSPYKEKAIIQALEKDNVEEFIRAVKDIYYKNTFRL